MASSTRPKRKPSTASSRTGGSANGHKTEITINVYDLLPPGRLSTLLWTLGSSLLHSGLVLNTREYAYGGHSKRHTTGVYYTRPRFEPPGGTFRCSILAGFTFLSPQEIETVLKETSEKFLGTNYNLLTNNCNHFTSALCAALTGRPGPGWLNRAAGIGLALPCMVPKEWVQPPDVETAEGELLDNQEDEEDGGSEDERAAMLDFDRRRERVGEGRGGGGKCEGRNFVREATPPPRIVALRDSSGRDMPAAERAPVPRKLSLGGQSSLNVSEGGGG